MQGTAVPFRIEMSGKNFRAVPAGQRTNAEGKQVSNKVPLATPDNEYELMRPDLTYIDLPDHLSLHEPTQKIKFVYFPNRGMVSQDRSTVSLAASVLQKKGIIDSVRGAVKVVSRRKLEKSACECYGVIQQFEDDLGLR